MRPDRRWPPAPADFALGAVAGVFLATFVLLRPSLGGVVGALREEHLFANLQALATTAAVLVGGWWTYSRYVRRREDQPILAVSHAVETLRLDAHRTLLHVTAWIENRGAVLVRVAGIETRVQHVHPLREAVLAAHHEAWRRSGDCLVPWGTLASRAHRTGRHQLEPTEREYAAFDFIVDARLQVVSLYTFVPSADAPGADADAPDVDAEGARSGWSCRTLYRIPAAPTPGAAPRRLVAPAAPSNGAAHGHPPADGGAPAPPPRGAHA